MKTLPEVPSLYFPSQPLGKVSATTDRSLALYRSIDILDTLLQDWVSSPYEAGVSWFVKEYVLLGIPRNLLVRRNLEPLIDAVMLSEEIRNFIDNVEYQLFSRLNLNNTEWGTLIESLASGIAPISEDVAKEHNLEPKDLKDRRISYDTACKYLRSNRWLVVIFLLTLVRPIVLTTFIKSQEQRNAGAST